MVDLILGAVGLEVLDSEVVRSELERDEGWGVVEAVFSNEVEVDLPTRQEIADFIFLSRKVDGSN